MENIFSINLRRIRKEKGITQEQLADAVGVSPQAVSKWEISSYPDASLLPAIADFLGVTVDMLYGRKGEKETSLNQKVTDSLRKTPYDQKLFKSYELCRAIMLGNMGCDEYADIPESILDATEWESHSQITREDGWLQARLNGNLQYFLLMPEPECGYDSLLAYNENTVKLFEFLATPDALRAMYFLAGRSTLMLFTAKALASELGITEEKAKALIDGMLELKFVLEADLNTGDSRCEKIYQWLADCNFVSFINFTRTLLNRPRSFNYNSTERETPFFKKDTYKAAQKEI